jgi:hypothetical protein
MDTKAVVQIKNPQSKEAGSSTPEWLKLHYKIVNGALNYTTDKHGNKHN